MLKGTKKARWRQPLGRWFPLSAVQAFPTGPVAGEDSVALTVSYDHDTQTLTLRLTRFDLSEIEYEPCVAEVSVREIGPFGAASELLDFAGAWTAVAVEAFDLPEPFGRSAFPEFVLPEP